MQHFRSPDDYKQFAWIVRNLPNPELDSRIQEFLYALSNTVDSRIRTLAQGSSVWRAQLGVDERPLSQRNFRAGFHPHPAERMKPTAATAGEGRVNPKGFPCFYCANTKRTAMSEIRPWLGSRISIARFMVNRSLRLLNVAPQEQTVSQAHFSPQEKLQHDIWNEVGLAYSEPVTRDAPSIEYAPTQMLAAFFRAQGFDGLLYKSLLAGERNIAIFDLSAVDLQSCGVREVRSLEYGFGRVENEYKVHS